MHEYDEIIENFKELQVGKTVKLVYINSSEELGMAVGVVKKIHKDCFGYVHVTFSDYVSSHHMYGVHPSYTAKWYDGNIKDNFDGDWLIKITISACTKAAYKEVARQLRDVYKNQVSLLSKDLAESKKRTDSLAKSINDKKKALDNLKRRFKI